MRDRKLSVVSCQLRLRHLLLYAFLTAMLMWPLGLFGQSAEQPTAQGVVEQAEARYKNGVANEDTTLSVKLIDSRGRENVRKLRLVVAYGSGDEGDKKLLRFLEPEDLRGSGLLNREEPEDVRLLNPQKTYGQWIFLKKSKVTRRIASSSGERFFGTDYLTADTRSENTRQWTYRNLTEETLTFPPTYGWRDVPCYRVEAIPREGTETVYTRRLLWVHHDLPIIVKEEFYDRNGLMKTRVRWGFAPFALDAGEEHTVLRAQFEKMTNHRGEHHETILEVLERHVNQDLPDSMFTTRELEKGR